MVNKKSLADAYLERARRPGAPCKCCRLPARADLERELEVFNAARKRGASAGWAGFHAVLQEKLPGYISVLDYRSLLRHMRKCLGWEIY
jgi:hypothetical protein